MPDDTISKQVNAVLTSQAKRNPGIVFHLSDKPFEQVDTFSTGSLALDHALGVGGIPRGRWTEIVGPESTGKSGVCYHACADAQKQGFAICYIETEGSFPLDYARACGLDVDAESFIISQPDYLEQAFEIAEVCARNGFGIVVLDSIVGVPSKAELEGEFGESHPGMQARIISQAVRKLVGVTRINNTAFIFVNQIREKIGGFSGFGPPAENKTGGRQLKYATHVSIDLRRIKTTKGDEDTLGNLTIRATIKKNKLAPPFRRAEYTLVFGKGISHEIELIELGTKYNILKKRGTYYSYNDESIAQGLANAAQYLKDRTEVAAEIEGKIRAEMIGKEAPLIGQEDSEEEEQE